MKKLNENLLRKLIIETIEEQSGLVTEGKKKKKIKEAEPVPQPSVIQTLFYSLVTWHI